MELIYTIYHPKNDVMNHDCLPCVFQYETVCQVKASSLPDAYMKSQNDFNRYYRSFGKRSTACGDIIADQHGNFYILDGLRFQPVSASWIRHINEAIRPFNPQNN